MLTHQQIIEIEITVSELNDLNEVLSINLEKYTNMQKQGFGCAYISELMQEKIDYIKSFF